MKIYKTYKAKSISYDSTKKRSRKDVRYIVVHYTGNKNDTAKNNAVYFATSNTRAAGAHFFVDRKGEIYRSIPMNRAAWSVGGFYTDKDGAAKYYNKCTNNNSVSIELCDVADKDPSTEQIAAVEWLIEKYIRKYCPNAKTIIRHWDVNGKTCPARMVGTDNKKWKNFKKEINN